MSCVTLLLLEVFCKFLSPPHNVDTHNDTFEPCVVEDLGHISFKNGSPVVLGEVPEQDVCPICESIGVGKKIGDNWE